MTQAPLAAVTALILAAFAMSLPSPAHAESYSLTGSDFVIYNLAGRVEVVSGSGNEVRVEVTRGGRDCDVLEIKTGTINGRSTLRVLYPRDRILYPRGKGTVNRIAVRRDGTFGGEAGFGARRVSVSSRGGGMEAWADLRISVPAGRATEVRLAVGNLLANGVQADLRLDTHSGPVKAEDITGSLHIDTGSGAVEVQGVRGDLLVDTGSGSVIVGQVRGSSISIDTGSGAVEGSGLEADRLNVDTGSGSVSLATVQAPEIRVDTGSGAVFLDLEDDVDRVRVDTGSGGVTMTVPDHLGAMVDIETGSGGVMSDVAMTRTVRSRGALHGRIGDGRGSITIDTGSGGVRILN